MINAVDSQIISLQLDIKNTQKKKQQNIARAACILGVISYSSYILISFLYVYMCILYYQLADTSEMEKLKTSHTSHFLSS